MLAKAWSSGTFRLSIIFSTACIASGLLLFTTIYWQTKRFETRRIAAFVSSEANAMAQGSLEEISWSVHTQVDHTYHDKYHNMTFSALFAPDGRLIAGDLAQLPGTLPADGRTHEIKLQQPD